MDDPVTEGSLPVSDPRDAERQLWSAYGQGVLVDLRTGQPDADDPASGDSWDESRRVRAEVVTALLLGAVKPVAGYVSGLRLAGGLIEGTVDVRRGNLGCALELTSCCFDNALLLAEAHTRTVDLSGSVFLNVDATAAQIDGHLLLSRCQAEALILPLAHITGRLALNGAHLANPGKTALFADGLTVGGGMFCQDGFQAEGEIRLIRAHITGELGLDGAHLANPGKTALSADQMTVEGGMFCQDGFHAEGEIRLTGAHITGQLNLDGAHLANPGKTALSADQMTVESAMLCQDRFQAEGGIRLTGAHITGQLVLDGAHLVNPGETALFGDGLTVEGAMFCLNGFQAEGAIRLTGAHITGQLGFSGVHLVNPGETALSGDGLTVGGGMFCQDGFHAEGGIRLTGAHITGQLVLDGAHLANPGKTALSADGLTVEGAMFCQDGFQAEGEIGLMGAHTGRLSFEDATLANSGSTALYCYGLQADALLFDNVKVTGTVDLRSVQVGVLKDNPPDWPEHLLLDGFVYSELQPYANVRGAAGRLAWLARAEPEYRPQPYEQLALYYRRLGHDEEARRVLVAKQRRRRTGLSFPGKIFNTLLNAIVGYGYRPGRAFAWLVVLITVGSVYFTFQRPAPLDPAHHPHFQPVLYTADLVIPIVSLGQNGTWNLTGPAQWVAAALIASGWILATTVIAGISRLLTRT